jgi:Holliday junction resolvase RusA-like endonuclease
MIKTPNAKRFVQTVRRLWAEKLFAEGRTMVSMRLAGLVEVAIDWYTDGAIGDVDNRIKLTLDGLKALAFWDDDQVRRVSMESFTERSQARLEVTIRPYRPRLAPPPPRRGEFAVEGESVVRQWLASDLPIDWLRSELRYFP